MHEGHSYEGPSEVMGRLATLCACRTAWIYALQLSDPRVDIAI